ncbi:MAG: NTP transferase domain-containing protein [Euryarchaeota archaeon]|jgi:CTP:molybdopterin cytidylyltransferase MocA|nr:NTP transferase domain-containing protein [Euryarchaeota archaeon]
MNQLYAVVLAAGSSERLGQPKAMVPVTINKREIPLIKWVVERLEYAGITPIIVTNQDLLVPITFALPERKVVLNPAPEKGRTGSIQCGLATIIAKIKGKRGMNVLITPVDRPGFSKSTLEALRHSEVSACPAKDGKGAHPVLIMEGDVERILLATPETPLRDLISPMRINVADEFLHLNIDTPEDLLELQNAANIL